MHKHFFGSIIAFTIPFEQRKSFLKQIDFPIGRLNGFLIVMSFPRAEAIFPQRFMFLVELSRFVDVISTQSLGYRLKSRMIEFAWEKWQPTAICAALPGFANFRPNSTEHAFIPTSSILFIGPTATRECSYQCFL
jgi:hypothetical protein